MKSESSVIPFLVPRRKVWLTPTAPVPCSNVANIGERKTWTQSELCTGQNSVGGQEPPKCTYSVPAQETGQTSCKVWLASDERRRCSNEAKTRNPLKFAGCSKLTSRSRPLVGQSSPHCENMWRRYCCLKVFFPIVDICLKCEDIARRNCAMVRRWLLWAIFCILYFQRAACSTFRTCILNSH